MAYSIMGRLIKWGNGVMMGLLIDLIVSSNRANNQSFLMFLKLFEFVKYESCLIFGLII